MLRPLPLLPALVAVVASLAPAPATAYSGDERPPHVSRALHRTPPATAPDATPLEVTITSLSPSSIPVKGPIRVSGSVTNTSEDTWRNNNVYAFIGNAPITTRSELDTERERGAAEPVGDRITDPGTFDRIDDLGPGESTDFSLKVPQDLLGVSAEGVYWFGVHALGEGPDGRGTVPVADGRARTFLPLVARTRRHLDTALVIPVRHDVEHADDGSIADVDEWAEDLDAGPLRTLVDFGASAGSRPVTWLVDPAVIDTVQALVAGNAPRSLDDTVAAGPGDGEGEESADPEPTDDPSESAPAEPGQDAAPDNEAVAPGTAWLDRAREAMTGNQVLALPYGDIDVAAAAEWDPPAYTRARKRSGRELAPWGLTTTPAVSSPSGFFDPAAIGAVHRTSTLLVTEEMFGAESPTVRRAAGQRLVVTSAADEGGPLPGDALSAINLRQQIVSDAALRLLSPGRKPLVVVMPGDWDPGSTSGFFEGLDASWLNLIDLAGLDSRPGTHVRRDRIAYPDSQVRRELDAANFSSASALTAAGETLQNMLTRNEEVAASVRDEAFTGLSYSVRDHPDASRAAADRSRRWIEGRLGSVTINAPPAVTLSSSSGRFAATLTNGLDQAVTVRVQAVAEEPLRIEGPETIEIAAGSSTSVFLNASAAQLGVSNVELIVTDESGTPLGSSDDLPVRSVQVSKVIWLIIGTGVALLFGAIIIRLIRRVRRARAA